MPPKLPPPLPRRQPPPLPPRYDSATSSLSNTERIIAYGQRNQWVPNDLPDLRTFRVNAAARRLAVRAMLSDEKVKTGLLQKTFGVSQLDLQSTPCDDSVPADVNAAEFCHYALTGALPGGIPQLVESVALPAILDTHSLCEPVWPEPGNFIKRGKWRGKRTFAAIKSRPPTSYELIEDQHSNIKTVRYNSSGGTVDAPPSEFLIFTYLSLYSSPHGWTDVEAAYNHFLIKVAAMRLRNIFLDRLAGGFIVAKSATPDDVNLKNDLATARGCGFIVLPLDADAQVLDLASGSDDKFRNAIADADQAILIAITQAYLHVVEGQNPNVRGNSQVAKQGSELVQWHLASKISALLTHQLGPMLVDENFLDAGYPTLTLSAVDPAFVAADLQIGLLVKELVGSQNMSKSEVYKRSGWGPPKDKDDVLADLPDAFGGLPSDPFAPVPEPKVASGGAAA